MCACGCILSCARISRNLLLAARVLSFVYTPTRVVQLITDAFDVYTYVLRWRRRKSDAVTHIAPLYQRRSKKGCSGWWFWYMCDVHRWQDAMSSLSERLRGWVVIRARAPTCSSLKFNLSWLWYFLLFFATLLQVRRAEGCSLKTFRVC